MKDCKVTIMLLLIVQYTQSQKNTKTPRPENPNDPHGWCLSPIDPGFCIGQIVLKYAFDDEVDKCVPFDYTGCGGNSNNRFNTLMECKLRCELY